MMKKQKIYAEILEHEALEQFNSAMEQDFVVQGALMPDAHTGYSLPIGSVVATKGVILPSWVGYDIGCGMCAVKTTYRAEDIRANASEIFKKIYELVPVGKAKNERLPSTHLNESDLTDVGQEAFNLRSGFKHLGTLGGGNHFIEIGEDRTNNVWIITHSGSRGVGHGIATAYMKLASNTDKAMEGHFGFEECSENGIKYINDLNWALDFALANRKHIIVRVETAISEYCNGNAITTTLINRNHNHAEYKLGLWIHRKGATHAEKNMMGVIPANMRDGSFIVKGKGNPDSLYSSSHGAGRVLSRRKAKEILKLENFEKEMEGITALVTQKTLDESPFAYKDIFEVMDLQKDLVEIVEHVRPLINIKG